MGESEETFDISIESLYTQALDDILGQDRRETNQVRDCIYKGDIAFDILIHCVRPDVPPPGINTPDEGSHYQVKLCGLDHDTAMLILTGFKDVFPLEVCYNEFYPNTYGIKRGTLNKELTCLGIQHMGRWITYKRDKTYVIHIRHMKTKHSKMISKILFEW